MDVNRYNLRLTALKLNHIYYKHYYNLLLYRDTIIIPWFNIKNPRHYLDLNTGEVYSMPLKKSPKKVGLFMNGRYLVSINKKQYNLSKIMFDTIVGIPFFFDERIDSSKFAARQIKKQQGCDRLYITPLPHFDCVNFRERCMDIKRMYKAKYKKQRRKLCH